MKSDSAFLERKTRPKMTSYYFKKYIKSSHSFFPTGKNNYFRSKKMIEVEIDKDIKCLKQKPIFEEPKTKDENILNQEEDKDELNTSKKQYYLEFIIQLRNLPKSKETDLLDQNVLEHMNQMDCNLSSMRMDNILKKNNLSENPGSNSNTTKSSCSSFSNLMNLETWGRPDYTKETEEAEKNKKNFDEMGKTDKKRELRELLNKITKDNFEQIKSEIFEKIKNDTLGQSSLADIIFNKAIIEKAYVEVYAQLCKDLDENLPQKVQKKIGQKKGRTTNSIFGQILFDKCMKMCKFQENINFDQYVKEDNEKEKESKIKKIILGNITFMSKLIKVNMLSKIKACNCINYLFEKYSKGEKDKYKFIYIEAILILLNNLGTLVQNEENSIKRNKKNELIKEKIEDAFQQLEKIEKDESNPGMIRYSIQNLKEKKNNNYKPSKYEKSIVAKSKKEIEELNKDISENEKDITETINKEENEKQKEEKNVEEKEEKLEEKEEENEEEKEEEKELTQKDINEKIRDDLKDYKQMKISEGHCDNFSWNRTTEIYDLKLKGFDYILEGFFRSAAFIKDNEDLKIVETYIEELLEFYYKKFANEEKEELLIKFVDLYKPFLVESVKCEENKIYDIYINVLQLFINYQIFKKKDFEDRFKAKERDKKDREILELMLQNITE